ncbi:DUF502 domain-containing protein [Lysobacter sp. HDW10]|jgi:uncharacterized membrane protein|uniref:DUF502 domain-containing protein n=1 Tax=Lysobacter sp. HDW10 TaxID=2714936 RepID=UPI00140BF27A|nr:DUF502 domain-containing protein [Lysobacter sp. HDW10]QIK81296.1 DUF502 domain-containing protein [Lysobacter sp. HDW10]
MPNEAQPRSLRRLFLTGLLTLLPIWLTWVVVRFVFVTLSDISRPWVEPALSSIAASDPAMAWITSETSRGVLAMIGTVVVVLIVGAVAGRVVGQRILRAFDRFIQRVPLANSVYSGARKLLDILQTSPDGTQRVVLIEFPAKGMRTVGFVTRVLKEEGTGRELAAVYVPTTPNPTGGYLEIVPIEDLIPTDWTVDQAMSFIISGGAVAPADKLPRVTPP